MKMKNVVFLAILSMAVMSCKKCAECHYDGVSGDEVEIGEYCGDDLEAIEASGFVVSDSTYEVHCHDH